MAYRRLYLPALVMAVLAIVMGVSQEWIVVDLLGYWRVPRWIERVSTIGFSLLCGVSANPLVLRRARQVFHEVTAAGLEGPDRLQELARRGGTRPWHAAGCVGALIVVLVAVGIVLALLEEGLE